MSSLVKALLVCGTSVAIATSTIVGFANPIDAPENQAESTKEMVVCEDVVDEVDNASHKNKTTHENTERNHDDCYDNGFDYGFNLALEGYPDDFEDDGLIVCSDKNGIIDCSIWVEGFEEGCKWGEAEREAINHGHPQEIYIDGCEEDSDEDEEDTLVTTEDELEKPDEYDPETGSWTGDDEPYNPESGLDEYDWGLEHGKWTEAREEFCRDCGVWAKYGTCPVCEKEVW